MSADASASWARRCKPWSQVSCADNSSLDTLLWFSRSMVWLRSSSLMGAQVSLENLETSDDYVSIAVSEDDDTLVDLQIWEGPTADVSCELLLFDLSSYEMTDQFSVGIYAELRPGGRVLIDNVQFVVLP